MHRAQGLFVGQARLAAQVQRVVLGLPACLHKQVGESRVGLVGALWRQCHLGGRRQGQGDGLLAGIAQLHLAQLAVVLRADPDGAAAVQVRPLRIKHRPVGLQAAAVAGLRVGRRAGGDGRPAVQPVTLQVEVAAQLIAQQVIAPACQAHVLPLAVASAVAAQHHGVAAVGQQVGGGQGLGQRCAVEHQAGRAGAACGGQRQRVGQQRHLTRGALLQQGAHGAQQRVGHGPAARRAVGQHTGDGHQRHGLVVRHEGVYRGKAGGAVAARRALAGCRLGGNLALRCEVQGFDEAHRPPRPQRLQRMQVGQRLGGRHQQRHHAGVRRHHALVGRGAAQCQPGHALWAVLVGQGVVLPGNGRLRQAPGCVVALGLGDLRMHGAAVDLVEHTALGLVQHQRGHQILKHRARPGFEAHLGAAGKKRPAQRSPVQHRHIALGDRQQAGEAGFTGQQVVVAVVQLLGGHAVADVQQLALGIKQHGVVGRHGHHAAAQRNGVQACGHAGGGLLQVTQSGVQHGQMVLQPGQGLIGAGCLQIGSAQAQAVELNAGARQLVGQGADGGRVAWPLQAGAAQIGQRGQAGRAGQHRAPALQALCRQRQRSLRSVCRRRAAGQGITSRGNGQQVAAAIAAVHRGHIGRLQHRQGLGVVPVVKVAGVARQAVQRVQRGAQAVRQLGPADEAQGLGAGGAEQVHADVGGRRAVRHHGVRAELHVVGWQMLVIGGDMAFEITPGVAGQVVQVVARWGVQRGGRGLAGRLAGEPHPQRRAGPQQQQCGSGSGLHRRTQPGRQAKQPGQHGSSGWRGGMAAQQ